MNNIRRVRCAKGWTVRDLAMRAGLSYQAVSYLEQHDVENPRLDNARMLARALGTTVNALWPVEEAK